MSDTQLQRPAGAVAACGDSVASPSPVSRETLPLPTGSPGTERSLTVLRYGVPGARPKAYLQAGLHADELPGMLTLRDLGQQLEAAAARGDICGEIVLVPVANPIGLAQRHAGYLHGRAESGSGLNFNRGYPDLAPLISERIAGRLGPDSDGNTATIRSAMAEALAELAPVSEIDVLRHRLLSLAHDADFVLDLHADNEALVHMYTGTRLWPGAADLAADIDARAVLLCEESGGRPFDEACSGPWWALQTTNPDVPVPAACLAATLELRSNNTVDETMVRSGAVGLLRFLTRRGLVAGKAGDAPRLLCRAGPLTAMQQVKSPVAGIVVYKAQLGDTLRKGDVVASITDPLGGSTDVKAATDGLLFARHDQPWAWPGKIIGKIAGAEPLPERTGALLTD